MSGDVQVRMRRGWAVILDGQVHAAGDTLDLDARTAAHWCSRGWAEPVPAGLDDSSPDRPLVDVEGGGGPNPRCPSRREIPPSPLLSPGALPPSRSTTEDPRDPDL